MLVTYSSWRLFVSFNLGSVHCTSSSSINFAWIWQSQIPFVISERAVEVIDASYLGPPGAAAVMCAATPTLIIELADFALGPTVTVRQIAHRKADRFASATLVALLKSSL
jgi:hypothetical protein